MTASVGAKQPVGSARVAESGNDLFACLERLFVRHQNYHVVLYCDGLSATDDSRHRPWRVLWPGHPPNRYEWWVDDLAREAPGRQL